MTDIGSVRPGSEGTTPPLLQARAVSKAFPSSTPGPSLQVVRDFNIDLKEGELITVFGPNGCGKTTVLNILAGLIEPDFGALKWNVSTAGGGLAVGYVFQAYSDTLLPWRRVRANVALPLELRKVPKADRAARVTERFAQLHLSEHADKFIYQLSGGLRQLVAIAQATVYKPRLLLLDEPTSALDYSLSRAFWHQFREFWAGQGVTTIFVSHNVDEAVFLGDRVCVLSARPAQVVALIPVPFGRERPLSLLSSAEFFTVRTRVLEAFERGRR